VRTPIFQIDAFTTRRFAGNPAAVMPMDCFPDDAVLQAIAAENNLAETAFLVSERGDYRLSLVHARHRGAALRPHGEQRGQRESL
jgi:PhzF family phenazine biosynthesis protein